MEHKVIAIDSWLDAVKEILQCEGRQLSALFAVDERQLNGNMVVYGVFADPAACQFIGIKTLLPPACLEIPSLVAVTPAAAWYEREIHDLFGIVPVGHPDLRPLVLHENWPHGSFPMCKDFSDQTAIPFENKEFPVPIVHGEGVFEVPVGPIHAGIIEPGHFRFSQAGEHIINLEAKLFFTHRGIEKSVEGLPVETALYRVERICGACSVSHAISYSQALESIASLAIPHQARLGRVIFAELERLYNHIGDIGNLCAGLGFSVGISHGARLKETMMSLNESITGNRFLRGAVIPGGLRLPVDHSVADLIRNVLDQVEPECKDLIEILRDNTPFLDRVNTTGIVPREAAVELALVGFGARASGVYVDVRHDFPYAGYGELDYKVPVYSTGDVAARLWVRADEVIQSFDLIRQALAAITDTNVWRLPLPDLPAFQTGLGWSESPRGSNLHWLMTGEKNTLYRLFVRSASYPNWPALAVAAPGNIIPDFPLINKSFELCYACIDR